MKDKFRFLLLSFQKVFLFAIYIWIDKSHILPSWSNVFTDEFREEVCNITNICSRCSSHSCNIGLNGFDTGTIKQRLAHGCQNLENGQESFIRLCKNLLIVRSFWKSSLISDSGICTMIISRWNVRVGYKGECSGSDRILFQLNRMCTSFFADRQACPPLTINPDLKEYCHGSCNCISRADTIGQNFKVVIRFDVGKVIFGKRFENRGISSSKVSTIAYTNSGVAAVVGAEAAASGAVEEELYPYFFFCFPANGYCHPCLLKLKVSFILSFLLRQSKKRILLKYVLNYLFNINKK